MITTNILLGVIALVSLYRVYLVTKKTTVKDHFKAKQLGTQKMRWDLVFKKFKTQEIREDIRKEYDFMKARVSTLDNSIEKEEDKNKKKELKETKEAAELDLKRLEGQMAQLDMEVIGAKPSQENPNGHIGLNEQIESLEELEAMLGSYRKSL